MKEAACFNFDVRFTKEGSGYRAEILGSPGGTGQHSFAFPFEEKDLKIYFLTLGNRRSGMRGGISEADEMALKFGSKLFDAVFSGELETAFERSLEAAGNAKNRLRIRLRLGETPELADLPWEYLYQSRRKRFLARSEYFPVVRYFDLPERETLPVTPPLRVLVMLSNPSDQTPLEVEEEYKKLKEAVKDLEEQELLAVERLGRATLSELQERLQRNSYHIFHFVGHGQFDPTSGQSFLALEKENGRMRLISGIDIGSFLSDEHSLRLVVLNACEGGRASTIDATSGVAQSLVLQGIPAVIAMQFEVSDEAAIALASGFYKALANNYPVDAALSEARKAIYAADCGVEWGTPVLYLNVSDGRIFDVQTVSKTERQRSQIDALLKQFDAALAAEDLDRAKQAFDQVLALFPPGVPVGRRVVAAMSRLIKLGAAKGERQPNQIDALLKQFDAAIAAEDFGRAKQTLDNVAALCPRDAPLEPRVVAALGRLIKLSDAKGGHRRTDR